MQHSILFVILSCILAGCTYLPVRLDKDPARGRRLAYASACEPFALMSALSYAPDLCDLSRTARFELRLGALGWKRLSYWPSKKAEKRGLHFEIWINETVQPRVAVIAIRGTEFSDLNDWHSNLRWMFQGILGQDQYDVVNSELEHFFCDYALQIGCGDLLVVVTGHSLGGGLAQCVLYEKGQQVRQAYVFDPSPVTAFIYRNQETRRRFVQHAPIEGFPSHLILRVYERGEILAYVRSATRLVWPIKEQIGEIGFNAGIGWSPINQHSMADLASAISNEVIKEDSYPAGLPRPWYWGQTARPPVPMGFD
jgi:pimeloyl-ACP methyl ester carboxylesterase